MGRLRPAQALTADDYAVQVVSPNDDKGAPIYQPTREEDVNVFDGDARAAQEDFAHGVITPEAQTAPYDCVAAGDPCVIPPPANPPSQEAGFFPDCVGDLHKVVVTNQAFEDVGGSPFKGQERPLCDVKLVTCEPAVGRAAVHALHPGAAADPLLGSGHQRPRAHLRQAQLLLR